MKAKAAIWTPFLLGVYAILFLFAKNRAYLTFSDIWVPLFVTLGVATICFLVWYAWYRDPIKPALLTTVVLVWLLFYKHIENLLVFLNLNAYLNEIRLLLLWTLCCGVLILVVVRASRARLYATSRVLNFFVGVLLLLVIGGMVASALHTPGVEAPVSPLVSKVDTTGQAGKPHIVYIVMDAYGRTDVLNERYHYDNTLFIQQLEALGFYVARQSNTNYVHTLMSLASSLNMTYLDEIAAQVGPEHTSMYPLVSRIQDSKVVRTLRNKGYTIVSLASGFEATDGFNADVTLKMPNAVGEFGLLVIFTTPVEPILNNFFPDVLNDLHRDQLRFAFANMPKALTLSDQPSFVLAHLLTPHAPHVFGPNGEEVATETAFKIVPQILGNADRRTRQQAYIKGYRGEVEYSTKQILGVIQNLISTTTRPLVVILQGDHGPQSQYYTEGDRPTRKRLNERLPILNAIYTSGDSLQGAYPAMTPVNTFRLLFNQYLNTAYPPLPDRSYFSPYNQPYVLTEVGNEPFE